MPEQRRKVRFVSGDTECAAWHYPGTNGACDAFGALTGHPARLVPLTGEPGTAMLTTPDSRDADRAFGPDPHPDWQRRVAARSALRLGFYQPGRQASRVRCPLLVMVCDQDQSALAGPAARAARRAPRAELVRLQGTHYAPFLDEHEQAVDAQLSFLRRQLLEQSAAGAAAQPGAGHD